MASTKNRRIQAVKGMYDMLPPDSRRLEQLEQICFGVLQRYGYLPQRTPIVEYTQLFARSIGEETDIVEKEMYTFDDRDGRSLTMRPEGTASVVRSYVEHSLHKQEQLTRWYYVGPMFRHERWQRGRYRQFHQIGVEALGVDSAGVDAEMLDMLLVMMDRLGLAGQVSLHLNSLGCPECRPTYRSALLGYLEPREGELCEDCKRRFRANPLRVLDCKVDRCRAIAADAPKMLEHLCGACEAHWGELSADLDVLGVAREIDHRLVRGLDYYTRTTFELLCAAGALGAQNTVAGGGRYDGLVEVLGGPPTPGVGFAMGLERLLLALDDDQPPLPPHIDVCFTTQGAAARSHAVGLAARLRRRDVSVDVDHRGASVKSQMKRANRLGARLVVVLGERELERGVATLRQMDSSEQRELPSVDLVEGVLAELGRPGQP